MGAVRVDYDEDGNRMYIRGRDTKSFFYATARIHGQEVDDCSNEDNGLALAFETDDCFYALVDEDGDSYCMMIVPRALVE